MKRWFRYTLIVGSLPLIIRCFILLFLQDVTWSMFINPIDFVFLGLTLNLTNINELNSLKRNDETKSDFKEDSVWWSVFCIIFLAVNLGVLYLDEFIQITLLKALTLKLASVMLCVFSLIYSFFIIKKLDSNSINWYVDDRLYIPIVGFSICYFGGYSLVCCG